MRQRRRPRAFKDPRIIVVHMSSTPARLLAWKKMWALLLSDVEEEAQATPGSETGEPQTQHAPTHEGTAEERENSTTRSNAPAGEPTGAQDQTSVTGGGEPETREPDNTSPWRRRP